MLRDDDIWEFSSCPRISFSANDIVKSFDASKLCEDAVILFFSKCLMDDYESFRSERIILDPFITVREDSTYNFLFFAFVSSDSF